MYVSALYSGKFAPVVILVISIIIWQQRTTLRLMLIKAKHTEVHSLLQTQNQARIP
jgi:hypothetical protein